MIFPGLEILLSIPFGGRNQLPIFGGSTNEPNVQGNTLNKPIAHLKNGTIAGTYLATYDQNVWLGIPFAQPPTGDNRYRRPQSLTQSWGETRVYDEYSPFCIGYGSDQAAYTTSEDCLTINVIKPAGDYDKPLPVATWIHGGGFFKGSSSDQRYNLSFIVEQSVRSNQPVIGVSFNYRLGPWGFLASPALAETGNLNLGLYDQRLALHWIQENILGFGGDSEKVTIWGESAGGSSVGFHLLAFGGRNDGLFRGAIMQSGSPIPFLKFETARNKQRIYKEITEDRLNCSSVGEASLTCLRSKTVEELNQAFNVTKRTPINTYFNETETWMPILDGEFLEKRPTLQLADGDYVHVPVIIGTCTDEGTAYAPIPGPTDLLNATEYFIGTMVLLAGYDFTERLMKAYPVNDTFGPPYEVNTMGYVGNLSEVGMTEQYRRMAAYFGDYLFIANHRKTCQTWADEGQQAYCFRFNAQSAGQPWHFGIKHLQDVAFVFYNLNGSGYDAAHNASQGVNPFKGKPQSYRDLADLMSRTWVSFVHDLDPNSFRASGTAFKDVPPWPLYGDDAQQLLFDADVGTRVEKDDYRAEAIGIINSDPSKWNR